MVDSQNRTGAALLLLFSLPRRPRSVFQNDPDIAVENRIAVALQLNRPSSWALRFAAAGRPGDLPVIEHDHAIVLQRDDGVLNLFAVSIVFGGLEKRIVSLPLQRRKTHVDARRRVAVDRAAL